MLPDGGYQFQLGREVLDSSLVAELDKIKKFVSGSQSNEAAATDKQKVWSHINTLICINGDSFAYTRMIFFFKLHHIFIKNCPSHQADLHWMLRRSTGFDFGGHSSNKSYIVRSNFNKSYCKILLCALYISVETDDLLEQHGYLLEEIPSCLFIKKSK